MEKICAASQFVQENFAASSDVLARSDFLSVTEDEIIIDKTMAVQKTIVFKERTMVSRNQVVQQPIIPPSIAFNSIQFENLNEDMEMSSQTSFMELCSQESVASRMEIASQESKIELGSQDSKIGLACQENEYPPEERSTVQHGTDLKRKHNICCTDESFGANEDILFENEKIPLREFESLQAHLAVLEDETSPYDGKNVKRLKK